MTFTLNAGEFDLGGGFVGRGTILNGEAYVVGTATTGVQGLLNTSGLEGIAFDMQVGIRSTSRQIAISFRASDDLLTGTISLPTQSSAGSSASISCFMANGGDCNPQLYANSQARFNIAPIISVYVSDSNTECPAIINSSTTTTLVAVAPTSNINVLYVPFGSVSNWRFLARDHATALTHYPTTTEEGSVFAASCINSTTQYGLWIAGAVGNRNGYFNQRQGDFAIVLLVNGSNIYFSVFSPAAENSTARNDTRLRGINIIPAPGQSGDDRFSELLLFRDQGNGYSERLGTVPGFIYVDMNKSENASLDIGDNLTIEPGAGTTYGLTNKGAIVAARWGLDISGTVSNTGSLFTLNTVSLPTSATLTAGNRNRWILENNQRIRFTATPPTGLDTLTDYWVRDWDRIAFTFQLSASEGGAAIVPGSNASSTLTRFAPLIAMACYKE